MGQLVKVPLNVVFGAYAENIKPGNDDEEIIGIRAIPDIQGGNVIYDVEVRKKEDPSPSGDEKPPTRRGKSRKGKGA